MRAFREQSLSIRTGAGAMRAVLLRFIQFVRGLRANPKVKVMKVCIDPGHGFPAAGAVGLNLTTESFVVLEVSQLLRSMLESTGHEVLMTRTEDRDVGFTARAQMANNFGADVFISIHCNAFHDRTVRGVETIYHHSPANKAIAERVQAAVVAATGDRDRGFYSRDIETREWSRIIPGRAAIPIDFKEITILTASAVPAVLVEIGFISNPDTEKLMQTHEWREKVARALFDSLVRPLHPQ